MTNRYRRTREDHTRESAEDYVELIDEMIRTNGEARAVDLAESMGVSHVTVGKTIKRLQREGLVITQPYRSIFLTEKGREMADASRRRHEVVVRFLLALGIPPDIAETDAEGIEHHVSDATLQAMSEFSSARVAIS